jgi:hypothetical protein
MRLEGLQAHDRRLIVVATAVTAISTAYAVANYRAAFPQASIDLQYSKDEIAELAQTFIAQQQLSTAGFRNLTLFDADEDARLYLERELGLQEANRLMQNEVSVWRWRARWFRPPDKEEIIVYYSPQGSPVGFRHVIAEAQPGGKLSNEAALQLAEQFLRRHTEKPHRLIEQHIEERPARLDHVFTWEQEGFRVKDATYRRSITVQGAELGEYMEFLHVPEQWERDFAALRASNELFQWTAEGLFVLLGVAAVAVVIVGLRRRLIPWRPLVLLCGAVGILTVMNELNTLPFFVDSLPTSSPYREMVLLGVLQAFGAGVGTFFYVIIAGAAGEPLYRRLDSSHLSLTGLMSRHVLGTRKFFLACVTGYGFAAAHIAFVVAFYLVGRRLGAWSPQDVEYSDLLSTSLPWLYPLTISVLASASEEFWFRLFAIPLLKWYLRSTWLAVLIPAFAWGFLHSNYPQQPGYVRGIEVGLIGVAAGFLMLRYGILSTLIWHYTVDAVLIGTFLFQSESWLFRVTGAVVAGAVLLPLAISVFLYRSKGGFQTDEAFVNSAAMLPVVSSVVSESTRKIPGKPIGATWPLRWLYFSAAGALLAGLIAQTSSFGDFIEVRISASEAATRADEALRKKKVEPGMWRRTVQFVTNLNVAEFEYIRRIASKDTANHVVRDHTFSGVWYVRYFRPMQSEEWRVYVDQDGTAYRTDHILDEKAPGLKLAREQALTLARRHLTEVQQIPLGDYRLVESNEQKMENRTDHAFVWEHARFRAGEATARISLSVVGDQVSHYRRFLKLPESWLREFRKPRLASYLLPAIAGAIGLPLLVVFASRLSSRHSEGQCFRWKVYFALGVAASVSVLLVAANGWSTRLADYDTSKPLENFQGQALLSTMIILVLTGGGVFVLATAADVFMQVRYGYRALTPPSFQVAVCTACLLWGMRQAFFWFEQQIPGDRFNLALWDIAAPDALVPAISVLSHAMLQSIVTLAVIIILGSAAVRYAQGRKGALLIASGAMLAALGRSTNVAQFAFSLLAIAVAVWLLVFLVRTGGLDLISFGVALFWIEAVRLGGTLAIQSAAQLRWNGISALVVCFGVGWFVLARSAQRASSEVMGYNR